jgi:hypothetical protein
MVEEREQPPDQSGVEEAGRSVDDAEQPAHDYAAVAAGLRRR